MHHTESLQGPVADTIFRAEISKRCREIISSAVILYIRFPLSVVSISIVEEVETAVSARKFEKDLTVALMGCAVNGPGEAQGADLGISLGRGRAHLFKQGKVVGTVPESQIVQTVLEAIEDWDPEPES